MTPPRSFIRRLRAGMLLLEALIAVGIFSIFLAGIGLGLLAGERVTVSGGDRTRAAEIAEQQLEGVRQMHNANFASVTPGTHGIVALPSGWTYSGSSVVTAGFRGSVAVSLMATDWLEVASTVAWNFGATRSGSLTITTELTNWRKVSAIGNWAAMTRINQTSISGTPLFQKIAIGGMYAYITGSQASGGKGLYIYDISSPNNPVRVASSFDLGASAYGAVVSGNQLFLATDDPTKEVQVYDVSSPASLSVSNLINSQDLPGSGRARSIAVYGDRVYVGATDDATEKQFYAVQMSQTGPMTLLGALGMSGSVLDLSLRDGYAYAATAYNVGELQVVDIFDPENLTFAPGAGIDMTNTQDGNAISTSGTGVLVGRISGSTIDEVTLYDVSAAAVPTPPPGPWTLENGADVNALAMIYGSRYAFLGGASATSQLKVLDLSKFIQSFSPVVKSEDVGATVLGLAYDWSTDRLYAITTNSVLVFAPG